VVHLLLPLMNPGPNLPVGVAFGEHKELPCDDLADLPVSSHSGSPIREDVEDKGVAFPLQDHRHTQQGSELPSIRR